MEKWKDIEGYEGKYQVSSLGRIKSLERYIDRGIKGFAKQKEIILKLRLKKGYLEVGLRSKGDKNQKFLLVHRIVATAFILNPENKKTVNHKNLIKTDNRLINLEWNTQKEQISHAIESGAFKQKGDFNSKSKLTSKDVLEIRYLYKTKSKPPKELSEKYKVSKSTIHRIVTNKIWKHI